MYAVILLAALVLNIESRKTLLLILTIAFTHYLPLQYLPQVMMLCEYLTGASFPQSELTLWYAVCITAETLIILYCWWVRVVAAYLSLIATFFLLTAHVSSMLSTELKFYQGLATSLETLQVVCFILASPVVVNYLVKIITPYVRRKF